MQKSTILIFAGAIAIGAVVGIATAPTQHGEVGTPTSAAVDASQTLLSDTAVATAMKRRREPKAGDHWAGCNDARAVGTTPIYRGEPGYDEEMDGDGDGIACEPRPGE
jgi:hypothetical protein